MMIHIICNLCATFFMFLVVLSLSLLDETLLTVIKKESSLAQQ